MSDGAPGHEYEGDFFDYINAGSLASARVICPLLIGWLKPSSLLDVGSGAGAWCKIWKENGLAEVIGVDGEYVRDESLLIEKEAFRRRDLSQSFDLERRFDLVTSLEVAEHVAESSAQIFAENLARHGDRILFSAAVPGQGGEFHVNEQPLDYWREKFEALGYVGFDALRPLIVETATVEPWYRYNTLLYVKESLVESLPEQVQKARLVAGERIAERAPFSWRARNEIIRRLPKPVVDGLVTLKHNVSRRLRST